MENNLQHATPLPKQNNPIQVSKDKINPTFIFLLFILPAILILTVGIILFTSRQSSTSNSVTAVPSPTVSAQSSPTPASESASLSPTSVKEASVSGTISPVSKEFAQADNTKRRSDLTQILNAVNMYMADNKGEIPLGITTTDKDIASTVGSKYIDLCKLLVTNYLVTIPVDPVTGSTSPKGSTCEKTGATYDSHYTISKNATSNAIKVSAPDAELGETISVMR